MGVVGASLGGAVLWACWRGGQDYVGQRAGLWVAILLGIVDFPFQKPSTALLATLALAVSAGHPKLRASTPGRED